MAGLFSSLADRTGTGQPPQRQQTKPAPPPPTYANPIDNPEAFDVAIVGGLPTPGVCKITDADREYDWDIKPSHGTDGASSTLKGVKLIDYVMTLTITTAEQWADFDVFDRNVESSIQGDKAKPMSIDHPILARKKINSCSVKKIGQPKIFGGGAATIAYALFEFKPPAPKGASTLDAQKARFAKGIEVAQDALRFAKDKLAAQDSLQRTNTEVADVADQILGIHSTPEERTEFSK